MVDLNNLSRAYFQGETISTATIGPVKIANSKIHGRGLTATKDIKEGECLFFLPAALAVPVDEVHDAFLTHDDNNASSVPEKKQSIVEFLAERILLRRTRNLFSSLEDRIYSPSTSTKLVALLLQVGNDTLDQVVSEVVEESFEKNNQYLDKGAYVLDIMMEKENMNNDCELIVKKIHAKMISSVEEATNIDNSKMTFEDLITESMIMRIIRRNVFGPEFHNHSSMEKTWKELKTSADQPYRSILGFYPLAAMINHSYIPNAVRVFVGDAMIVHTNTKISKGDEIVWSYTALNQKVETRQQALLDNFQFQCNCERTKQEKEATEILHEALGAKFFSNFDSYNVTNLTQGITSDAHVHRTLKRLRAFSDKLDRTISSKSISNEAVRYFKAGYLSFYMNYLNLLLHQSSLEGYSDSYENEVLPLASYLHFTLFSCNNASTEHLSILHLCYEIVSLLYSKSNEDSYRMKLKFWTEQLKKAVMTRYGSLGSDVNNVRTAMQHSKGVLRTLNGFRDAKFKFI